jgi:hypothetical protein
VVADGWYGDITDFRQGLDDRQARYVVGVYSDTQVFMEFPVFVQPDPQEKKRGRKRKYPKLIALESWKDRQCPVRSSERWRDRQRALKQKSSLPDVRHQIALYLMRMLI